jgi:streptogramin lyase
MSRLWSRPLSRFIPALVAFSTIPLLVLTGCGASTTFSSPVTSVPFTGKVFGGQKPIYMSKISVWQVGTTGYGSTAVPATALATATTAIDGSFSIDATYACTTGEQVYITASGGQSATGIANPNIMLAVGLGDCAAAQTESVEINEVTTAATAFALAQFFTPTRGTTSTDAFGTDPADLAAFTLSNQSTIPTLVDIASGTVKPNTSLITIESAKIYSIANTLAACVNDATGTTGVASSFTTCAQLFADTPTPAGPPPTPAVAPPADTLQAAVQMALYPYQNVSDLFKLGPKPGPFLGLGPTPNDWTIAVSYTSTDFALGINGTSDSGTSSTIDIDTSGNVWFPSNLLGSTGAGFFDPTTTAFNGPSLQNDLVHPQYLAVDESNGIWLTDMNSPKMGYLDSSFHASTLPTFATAAELGPIAIDDDGNAEFSWIDTSAAPNIGHITPSGTATAMTTIDYPPTGLISIYTSGAAVLGATSGAGTPCALAGTQSGTPFELRTIGTSCISGGIAAATQHSDFVIVVSSANEICYILNCEVPVVPLDMPEGIATDGRGNEWIANAGSASVSTVGPSDPTFTYPETSPVAYLHDTNNGSTMTIPYGIAIDGSGNVWISNASCVSNTSTPCTPTSFTLSELIGAAAPTIAPLSLQKEGRFTGTRP